MSKPEKDDLAPGDARQPGPGGAGEDVCPKCGGTGKLDGAPCDYCSGRGKIVVEIAGA